MNVRRLLASWAKLLLRSRSASSTPNQTRAAEIVRSNLLREHDAVTRLRDEMQTGSLREIGHPDTVETLFSGFDEFSSTGKTPTDSFIAMRHLHMQTKGQFQKLFLRAIMPVFPVTHKPTTINSKVFGTASGTLASATAEAIANFGICVLPERIPETITDKILAGLQGLPTTDDYGNAAGAFPDVGSTVRAFIQEQDLLRIKEVRDLALDPLLVRIARAHFGVEPIFESAIAFYTQPHTGEAAALSAAAQLYHVDCDYINFLKFFIYLSDVTETEGPHWFVQKSHLSRPDDYWEDRRFSDSEIEAVYPKQDIRCVVGQKGTLFAANTIAFHKGSTPIANSRLLLQLTYCSTLFGSTYNAHSANPFELDLIEQSGASVEKSRLLSRFVKVG